MSAAGPPEGGRPKEEENPDIIRVSDYGTSATHALRHLKRDNPDLAEKVVKGEVSAHAAAAEAGFRIGL